MVAARRHFAGFQGWVNASEPLGEQYAPGAPRGRAGNEQAYRVRTLLDVDVTSWGPVIGAACVFFVWYAWAMGKRGVLR